MIFNTLKWQYCALVKWKNKCDDVFLSKVLLVLDDYFMQNGAYRVSICVISPSKMAVFTM